MEIRFTVPGQPVPQGRPRVTTKPHTRVYDPPKGAKYKRKVKSAAKRWAPDEPLKGELEVELMIYKETLKSFSKAKKMAAESGKLRPITKPDVDNYAKGVLDALKDVIWLDDGQVVDLVAKKYYSEIPRVEVVVRELSSIQEELF